MSRSRARKVLAMMMNDSDSNDESEQAAIVLGLLLIAKERKRQRRRRREQRQQEHLTREALLPRNVPETPWQRMYNSRVTKSFIVTMGIDPNIFDTILAAGFDDFYNTELMPHQSNRYPGISGPQIQRRCLNSAGCLGLVLHFLNSAIMQLTLQQVFALTPATLSRYLSHGLSLLLRVLKTMPAAAIAWPNDGRFAQHSQLITARHGPLLDGAFGFVDCFHLPLQGTNDPAIQNAYYNDWLHHEAHFMSNVAVFAPTGEILHATLNAPGSHDDAHVALELFRRLDIQTPEGYWLIADTEFPHRGDLETGIRVPLKQGAQLPEDPIERDILMRTSSKLISAYQAAKWGMRALQGSFGRLKMPMPANDHLKRAILMEACCRLHQVRVRILGINHIRSVYGRIWEEEDVIYESFRTMMFGEIQRSDRIARYYQLVF